MLQLQVNHDDPLHALSLGRERVRALVEEGAADLAATEAVRALARHWRCPERACAAAAADLLSDLGVLRYDAADRLSARACLEAALELVPEHELARENHRELMIDMAERPVLPRPPPLNEALKALAAAHLGAGAEPLSTAEALATADGALIRWVGRAPTSAPLHQTLRQLRHALTPGGVAVLCIGPLLSGVRVPHRPNGDDEAPSTNSILPPWGHLTLADDELRFYLELTRGPLVARLIRQAWAPLLAAPLTEADCRDQIGRSGLHVHQLTHLGKVTWPSDAMALHLRALLPDRSRPQIEHLAVVLERRVA
ncbi:MAG: hypothetical protein JXX28_18435 [Deltaproteobacteria bacterium]|nr:hypothetical protein [Deltaproteobacteria bacterium]